MIVFAGDDCGIESVEGLHPPPDSLISNSNQSLWARADLVVRAGDSRWIWAPWTPNKQVAAGGEIGESTWAYMVDSGPWSWEIVGECLLFNMIAKTIPRYRGEG